MRMFSDGVCLYGETVLRCKFTTYFLVQPGCVLQKTSVSQRFCYVVAPNGVSAAATDLYTSWAKLRHVAFSDNTDFPAIRPSTSIDSLNIVTHGPAGVLHFEECGTINVA